MTDCIAIRPATGPVDADVVLPGSKSYTNRALLMAALATGESVIEQALASEDTERMINALRALGVRVRDDPGSASNLIVTGCDGAWPSTEVELFVGNAGTAMRFLTAATTLGRGRFVLDGVSRMRERPIQPLLNGLAQLGASARSQFDNGCPPVIVEANGLRGGRARMPGHLSSQFFSALLLTAPYAERDVEVVVDGELVGRPYLTMTAASMACFGVALEHDDFSRFTVRAGQRYRAQRYLVEPDASSASYFFAAAAVTGGRVQVRGLTLDSAQGDVQFVRVLEAMGCRVTASSDALEVIGPDELEGLEVSLRDLPDMTPTLVAIAPFARTPVTIRDVGFIRHHETDRLHALATELSRLGACVRELDDGLVIEPSPLHGATLATYDDHRMAMALAVTGLRVPGIELCNPDCVAKTFPNFFDTFSRLVK